MNTQRESRNQTLGGLALTIGALGALLVVVRLKNGPPVGTIILIAMPIVPSIAMLAGRYRRLKASIAKNGLDAITEPEEPERKAFAIAIITAAVGIALFGAFLLQGILG